MSDILCPRLTAAFTWNFETELARLAGSPLVFSQASLATPAIPFHGASAAIAHDGENLFIVAEMEDTDIFNSATTMNERTWMTGDVFEIFLRPESQDAYYEFHVTPENQIMQLRLENSAAFYTQKSKEAGRAAFQKNLIREKVIRSEARIQQELNRWSVMVSVPLARLCESKSWEAGDAWAFSFCRYDYTRGIERAVLSSSSPQERADFHNQSAWRRLVFNSGEALA